MDYPVRLVVQNWQNVLHNFIVFDVDKGNNKMGDSLGRVFKIHNFFCMIFDRFIKNFHALVSPR